MHNGEVQYYASPVLVKSQRYYATLTNERLVIEGGASPREFKVSSILAAYPERLDNKDPGLKLVLATPSGQKEMVWAFPLEPVFQAGEQEAWLSNIARVSGDKPFVVSPKEPISAASRPAVPDPKLSFDVDAAADVPVSVPEAAVVIAAVADAPVPPVSDSPEHAPPAGMPELIHGETMVINTAGVRIKRSFYTLCLTNLRLVLQNNAGKIGREFAIAELMDAAGLETEAGEPAIALSVGSQSGLKQMLLTFPSVAARDAWMREFQNKLPRRNPGGVSASSAPVPAERVGTFVPATNERVLVSTPQVRVKQSYVVLHLTNTRFVIDGKSGIMGEFAVNSLMRAVRMASEIGEPGISLKIGSVKGERDMHLIFSSMNDREAWMDALFAVIPELGAVAVAPQSREYTVTTVQPPSPENPQTVRCPACGGENHVDDEVCALCGTSLHEHGSSPVPARTRRQPDDDGTVKERRRSSRPPREPREPRERAPYNGSAIGFITRPSDAFAYYGHDGIGSALGLFFAAGAVWAFVTVLFVAYIVPALLSIDVTQFPIFSALQTNILLMVIFAVMLYVLWIVCMFVHALVVAILARVFEPSVRIGEAMAVVMRSSLTFAVVGWIPIAGMMAASVWTTVSTAKGLVAGQELRGGPAVIAAVVGCVVVYAGLFAVGMI